MRASVISAQQNIQSNDRLRNVRRTSLIMATTAFQPPPQNNSFYMNPQTGPSPPETYLYGKGTYTNGFAMAQTPPNHDDDDAPPANYMPSLNSPSHRYQYRQLRQPRKPLGIPAALRPTDPPARPTDIPNRPRAPDTPPASKDNSFDSMMSGSTTPHVGLSLGDQGEHGIVEESLNMIRRVGSEQLQENKGAVTGPPTTAHWKPDATAITCAICNELFTWFKRRHHCRHCGRVVCDTHSKHTVPLDQNAHYHKEGLVSKACDGCSDEWEIIKRLRRSRPTSRPSSNPDVSQATLILPPMISHQVPSPMVSRQVPSPTVSHQAPAPAAVSVGRSWNNGIEWSTF